MEAYHIDRFGSVDRGNGKPWGKSEQQRPLSAVCGA
jgi:hypothetical protein